MKQILPILLLIFCLFGCRTPQVLPIETITEVHYKDSTILHIKDSIRIIPIERYIDIVAPPDTLHLETSLASATAYYDSTFNALRGEIQNKKGIEERYKIIYKNKIVYRDSLITKEVPVEVEVPVKTHYPYEKYLWIISILSILYLIRLYLKF